MRLAEGRVFDQVSGEGLAGIAVTDGAQISRTGGDGSFCLSALPDERSRVWITVPDGWRAAGRFYRILPAGGDRIDFPLQPAPERRNRRFRLAQITDTHVMAGEEGLCSREELARELQRLVAEARPDLIIASGDLTNRGTVEELNHLKQAVEAVAVPVFLLFGGHDGNEERRDGDRQPSFTRHFEQMLGPAYFSFDWGGRHFVLYPTEEHFFSPDDQQRKAAWLRQDLEMQPPGRETVIVTHTPPTVEFLRELGRFRVRAVLYGHWHSSKAFSFDGIDVVAAPPLCFGGIDTEPRGYRLLEFQDRNIGFRLRAARGADLRTRTPAEIWLGSRRLELAWERKVAGGIHRAAPVAWEDSIWLSLRDEELEGRAGLLCLDADSGRIRWRVRTDASLKNSPVPTGEGGCAVLSGTGRVYLIDGNNGAIRWQADLPGYPERWIYTAPAVADGTVYAGGKSGYGAYRLATGERLWYAPLEDSDNWSCYASPCVYQDLLIALVQRRGLLAMDRRSGEIVWERALGVEYQYGTPVLAGDLLVSGGDARSLAVLRAGTGEVVWHRPVLEEGYASGLEVFGERICATTPGGEVRCHDLRAGALHWRFRTGRDLLDMTPYRRNVSSILGRPVAREGDVLAGANDGVLYCLDRETGTCLSRASFGAPISATPLVLEDGICIGTWDGRLCCFRHGSAAAVRRGNGKGV